MKRQYVTPHRVTRYLTKPLTHSPPAHENEPRENQGACYACPAVELSNLGHELMIAIKKLQYLRYHAGRSMSPGGSPMTRDP